MRAFWSVQAPLRFPDPLLPPDDPTPDPRPTPGAPKKIVCEFCACVLAPSGDYVSLSDRAKALRAQEETISALRDQVSDITSERDQARGDLDSARAQIAALEREKTAKRGFWGREVSA